MKRSTERILTTHTGSLPRPDDLVQLMWAKEEGRPFEAQDLETRIRQAVGEVVAQQARTGLDVIDDGEVSKPSYSTYVKDRLTGFEGPDIPGFPTTDARDYPGYASRMKREPSRARIRMPSCNGPIKLRDGEAVRRDIAALKHALTGVRHEEVFMTAVSPGQVARFHANRHYPSHEAYLWAIAEAMKHEYQAIVDAGFLLQLDCPDLASGRTSHFPDRPLEEFRKIAALHIEVLNAATAAIAPERMRLHLCWGNYAGPHTRDIPLRDIIDIVLAARPAALSFEAANPRHAHEWKLWQSVRLPAGKLLVPGVIDSCTNYVEHPELVAQRIVQYAKLVGRENVIAGVDCGFGTFVGSATVDPEIAWVKLGSLVEGARLASKELW